MSERRRTSTRRRRSSNGLSLLPSEANFCGEIPYDIPAEERALILIRKCYVRTLHKLRQEHDVPEDLLRALTVDGTAAFQNLDRDDILMKILRVRTAAVTAEDAVNYHKELGDLVAESKAWDQLLESGPDFRLNLPQSPPDPADVTRMRNHYKMLAENCARIVQAGSLQLLDCTQHNVAPKQAESGPTAPKQSARDILGQCPRPR